jgi:alkylated DNA repair dioxygenase AlkB
VNLTKHQLDDRHVLFEGTLPSALRPDFEALWELHPAAFHRIAMHGREVETPRWQRAYGADYHYTGRTNRALPVPPLLSPLLSWCSERFDERLNGLLLNWYDAERRHYIGRHRDSRKNMCEGAPIVTISLGEERVFRLRPWRGKGKRDFAAESGTLFVMPYATNLAWTHEVPHFARHRGRRISITLRAFA